MKNKTYDFFKTLVLVVLPASSAAYFSLSGIWGLPNAEQVVGSIAVVTVFLGTVLKISSNQYSSGNNQYDGALVTGVSASGKLQYSLEFDDLAVLDSKDKVILRVIESVE